MSRAANCYDNAFMESCFGTIKTELEFAEYENYLAARADIASYLAYYNSDRSLDHITDGTSNCVVFSEALLGNGASEGTAPPARPHEMVASQMSSASNPDVAAIAAACCPDATVDSVVETALRFADEPMRREIGRAVDIAHKSPDWETMRDTFYTYYNGTGIPYAACYATVSYTHLRAHETPEHLV